MILVTGATGLVGAYLLKLLTAKGEQVRALRRSHSDCSLSGGVAQQVEWVEGDVLDVVSLEKAMQGVEKVYHAAALISFRSADADYLMRVNVDGTANVMNTALYYGVSKVVHVSSASAFGYPVKNKIIDENFSDTHIRQRPWYYQSKQYGEREAWRAYAEGLNLVVVCPSVIIGGGWWHHAPNLLFEQVDKGLFFYTEGANGFVDVRDVAACMYRLMESPINGEKFLLTAENLTFREVIGQIADSLGEKRPTVAAGKWLLGLGGQWQRLQSLWSGKEPILTRQSAELACIDFCYDNSKIKRALNFQFTPIKKTIEDTAALYRQSRAQGKAYGMFDE